MRVATATVNARAITAIIAPVPFSPVLGELPGTVVVVVPSVEPASVVVELPPEEFAVVVVVVVVDVFVPLPSTSSLPTAEGCLVVVVDVVVEVVVVVDVVVVIPL